MLFIIVLFASLVCASFFGHVVHAMLHKPWAGPAHRAHLEHHLDLYPPGKLVSDRYLAAKWYNSGTLLFTPPFLIILGAAWGLLHLLGAPTWTVVTFGVTMLAFSLVSDWMHDTFHIRKHWMLRFEWFKRLRTLHFLHHSDMTKNLGIVFMGWDHVFGSFRRARQG